MMISDFLMIIIAFQGVFYQGVYVYTHSYDMYILLLFFMTCPWGSYAFQRLSNDVHMNFCDDQYFRRYFIMYCYFLNKFINSNTIIMLSILFSYFFIFFVNRVMTFNEYHTILCDTCLHMLEVFVFFVDLARSSCSRNQNLQRTHTLSPPISFFLFNIKTLVPCAAQIVQLLNRSGNDVVRRWSYHWNCTDEPGDGRWQCWWHLVVWTGWRTLARWRYTAF